MAARIAKTIGVLVLAGLIAACTATATAPRDVVIGRQQLDAHLQQCSARYGYDPEAASGLGPHALGSGEREWRECVYEGVEKFLMPKTLSPEAYRQAITEDRQMTARVAGGTMTRSERRERVQKIIEEIRQTEKANVAKLQQQALDRMWKEEMRHQDEMMLRTLRPLAR